MQHYMPKTLGEFCVLATSTELCGHQRLTWADVGHFTVHPEGVTCVGGDE